MWIDSSPVFDLIPQFYFHLWKKKVKIQRIHFLTGFTHEKKQIFSRKMKKIRRFFVLFFMWETKCGNKKKRPGYSKKNISSLIQTWKQKLISKTFHLVSQFVFHVWNRNIQENIFACVENQVEKEFGQEKTFFFLENLISFSVSNMKKTLKCISSFFLSSFFPCLEENKRNEKWFVLHAWNRGNVWVGDTIFFFNFQKAKN